VKEADIERYLVARVVARGGEVRKVRWIGRRGAPDRVVMLYGTWWVELKAPGEVAAPHQLREHIRMRRQGQRVSVVDSLLGVDHLIAEMEEDRL